MTPQTQQEASRAIDGAELNRLLGVAINDFGAVTHASLLVIGDRLGLYKALAAHGPLTAAELAKQTETAPRYVQEWCASQAAGGYITYNAKTKAFSLTPEQTLLLAVDDSPAFVPGAFQLVLAATRIRDRLEQAFKTGEGIGWHEHDHEVFEGTERFYRPGYLANLIDNWIPALTGVQAALERGIGVADLGCGHGASTILMAQAFPRSNFVGFDYHKESIETARKRAEAAGVADRVTFEVATAKDFYGEYGLVTTFDSLHDMGDPVGAAKHIHKALAPQKGAWLIVEPFADDKLEDNLNPIGRAYYAGSTQMCVPASLHQEVGLGLGAQAGEARLVDVIRQGGFDKVRRAAASPFNLILEATP